MYGSVKVWGAVILGLELSAFPEGAFCMSGTIQDQGLKVNY